VLYQNTLPGNNTDVCHSVTNLSYVCIIIYSWTAKINTTNSSEKKKKKKRPQTVSYPYEIKSRSYEPVLDLRNLPAFLGGTLGDVEIGQVFELLEEGQAHGAVAHILTLVRCGDPLYAWPRQLGIFNIRRVIITIGFIRLPKHNFLQGTFLCISGIIFSPRNTKTKPTKKI
jgi:hypothetical protein